MKTDYTHIMVILDRSGSMASIRDDTVGGFNTFVKDQKAEPGTATLTFVQFDSLEPFEVVHRFKALQEFPDLGYDDYSPRGSTPLLDALGMGINQLEADIVGLKEEDRPSRVVVAIVTDGQENASLEFKKDQIETMIKAKTEKDAWEFAFLSADLAAIKDAGDLGILSAKQLYYKKMGGGSKVAWNALSAEVAHYRSGRKRQIGFDQEEPAQPDDSAKQEP